MPRRANHLENTTENREFYVRTFSLHTLCDSKLNYFWLYTRKSINNLKRNIIQQMIKLYLYEK